MMTDKVGIYIHVPFCLSKCYYCDFCSTSRARADERELYTDRLCDEIADIRDKIRSSGRDVPQADTVYFGGGTPSLLEPSQIGKLLNAVERSFGIAEKSEITIEVNPKSIDRERLIELHALGINRISIGMQSTHDGELRALGRIHGYKDFIDIFNDAREAGFDNISVDLMYGIPKQTRESFEESVRTLASLNPEHISSYCLSIEENTVFYKKRDSLDLPCEDDMCDMYADMNEILANFGYKKYEISNFAHKGRESKHNLKYWRYDNYLGFGAAAHSFFDGVRYAHSSDISSYTEGNYNYDSVEKIGQTEMMNEYVMLGMRLASGIDKSKFESRFGVKFDTVFGDGFKRYSPEYVRCDEERCAFTEKGMFVSNHILADLLEFDKG